MAFVGPMVLFVGLLVISGSLQKDEGSAWLKNAPFWIYPLQTILCGALLIYFWSEYSLGRPAQWYIGIAIGLLVFFIWISPQTLFGQPARTAGFDPDYFANTPFLYWMTVIFRFLRLVVVVPLVEEIFWRGFLLRFLIAENFERVAFGKFSWLSFIAVTLGFGFSHSAPDWAAAFVTGALYNLVAYRTKSLSTCVLTHAVTNLALGLWIMHTRQWGFW